MKRFVQTLFLMKHHEVAITYVRTSDTAELLEQHKLAYSQCLFIPKGATGHHIARQNLGELLYHVERWLGVTTRAIADETKQDISRIMNILTLFIAIIDMFGIPLPASGIPMKKLNKATSEPLISSHVQTVISRAVERRKDFFILDCEAFGNKLEILAIDDEPTDTLKDRIIDSFKDEWGMDFDPDAVKCIVRFTGGGTLNSGVLVKEHRPKLRGSVVEVVAAGGLSGGGGVRKRQGWLAKAGMVPPGATAPASAGTPVKDRLKAKLAEHAAKKEEDTEKDYSMPKEDEMIPTVSPALKEAMNKQMTVAWTMTVVKDDQGEIEDVVFTAPASAGEDVKEG